jgi:ribulose 1,5-bisphosphate carboxylase large subunit-like protein
LPEEVYGWFGGPAYGVDEILTRFHVDEFPMLVGIIKPSLGPSLDVATIDRKLREVLSGGIHGVKDDEMQGDLPFARLSERINLAEKYGRYIPTLNLDDADSYLGILMNEKIGMALLNASIIGFPMLRTLRMMTRIPLLSHVAMQGTYLDSFCPKVFAQLHRLFGCDAFITPIGDVGYYRIDKGQEQDMVHEFVKELPIRKTLPLLTGGARLRNLREVMTPYQAFDIPYGIVFGTQIFGSDEGPAEMARVVVEKVAEIKAQG